jgi:hypothetical protein
LSLEDFPSAPTLSPIMMDLLNNTAPSSNPESMAELKKSFPPTSTPASLEALANAPTVPEKIIQKYIYKEALRTNSIALEKSLRAAIETRLNTLKRPASSPIENIRQAEFPIPSLRVRRGMPTLQINTNLPIGRGPRAPATTTVRQPDKSQITAANIIPGKRRR